MYVSDIIRQYNSSRKPHDKVICSITFGAEPRTGYRPEMANIPRGAGRPHGCNIEKNEDFLRTFALTKKISHMSYCYYILIQSNT